MCSDRRANAKTKIVAGFINIEIFEFFNQNYMIINFISYFLKIAGITQDIYRRLVNVEIDIIFPCVNCINAATVKHGPEVLMEVEVRFFT
jgi:hypothetical protein